MILQTLPYKSVGLEHTLILTSAILQPNNSGCGALGLSIYGQMTLG